MYKICALHSKINNDLSSPKKSIPILSITQFSKNLFKHNITQLKESDETIVYHIPEYFTAKKNAFLKYYKWTTHNEIYNRYQSYYELELPNFAHPVAIIDNGVLMHDHGDSLLDIFKNTGDSFSFAEKLKIFKTIAKIIKVLHNNDLVYQDIKLSNICIQKENNELTITLIDPDLMKKVDSSYFTGGTYTPPEILINPDIKVPNPKKIDIWSLGILLLYLFNIKNRLLTTYRNDYRDKYKIKKEIERLKVQTDYEKLNKLIENLLNITPNKRPTIDEVLTTIEEILKKPLPQPT